MVGGQPGFEHMTALHPNAIREQDLSGGTSGCHEEPRQIHSGMWPLLSGGPWSHRTDAVDVVDPDSGLAIAQVAMAGRAQLEAAVESAADAVASTAWPSSERAATLHAAADQVADAAERFARLIAAEGIKTIREARSEVSRAAHTLRLSAGAVHGLTGSVPQADDRPNTAGWRSAVRVGPVGVVAAITPYNDPLNLVAHKVGPALAAGNAVFVKPDPRTPLSALLLAQVLVDCGVPTGFLSVLPANRDIASALVADPRVRFVSFTGGRRTGALVQKAAGVRRTLMELGGVCPTILFDDADLDVAIPALVSGAYGAAGQNCIHVQRILVHGELYETTRSRLVEAINQVHCGPKMSENSQMGPLIDATALDRVSRMVNQAVEAGARILTGGVTDGPRYLPTLIEKVPHQTALAREEVFGPVATLEPFSTPDEAISLANRGGGGIHAGLFTSRREITDRLCAALDVGGVVIGGTSDNRSDALPFGGTGSAGVGREGRDLRSCRHDGNQDLADPAHHLMRHAVKHDSQLLQASGTIVLCSQIFDVSTLCRRGVHYAGNIATHHPVESR